jgi:hypothetical protein
MSGRRLRPHRCSLFCFVCGVPLLPRKALVLSFSLFLIAFFSGFAIGVVTIIATLWALMDWFTPYLCDD